MDLSLWISPDSQYGLPAPGEARTNTYQRAVEQALKQHLFKDQDAGVPTAAASPYNDGLRQFNAALTSPPSFGRDRQNAARLWQALLASDTPQEHPQASVQERIEGLFCLALHSLCAALAEQTVRQNSTDTSDEDEDEEDTDEANQPGVEYAETVRVLAEQLRRLAARWLRSQPEHERPENDDWNLVARLLLEPLLVAFKAQFVVRTLDQKRQRDGRPHTEKRIEIAQPELAQRIERLLETLPLSFSPQPLRHPPAYYLDDPGPSNDEADMCIRVDLIGYRQTNAFLRTVHHDLQCPEHRPPDFPRYVAAINVQQAVHWRINRSLLQCTYNLIALAKAPAADPKHKDLREWIQEKLYCPTKGPRKRFKLSAEFLDSPLARRALDELCPSDPQHEPPPFYLPWKADHRGRIYAETPWLTPQGGDLQRALLEFARGQVLDESGVRALRRHGANLVSTKRLIEDLGITERVRQVVTLDERERWTLDHEADILASAADPLAESFWRDVADEPMQFLAFCLAYRQWKQHPDTPIHLPVQIDGTCNGIQHIAALTGDPALARAVNVLPNADSLPADIYSELAEAALTTLGRLPIPKGQATHRYGLEWADAWLAAEDEPGAWLARKTAKRVVMTIPYGASRSAQAGAVLDAIADQLTKVWDARPPDESALTALVEWKNAFSARKDFVRKCTKGLFAEQRKAAFPKQDAHTAVSIRMTQLGEKTPKRTRTKPDTDESWTPERAEWERLRTFGAYVARALVEHLRGALDRKYPDVRNFSGWLGDVADAISSPRYSKTQLEKLVAETKAALDQTTKLSENQIKKISKLLDETEEALDQTTKLSENQIKKLVGTYKKVKEDKFEDAECQGLPLVWLTPLGFPVVQNKFALTETSITARVGSQSVKLGVQRLTDEVDPNKQRAALLPNLIHSLDATHLMMTLLEAKARGVHDIGSIHDCLLCHPNQAETLAQAVRRTFAELYAPDGEAGLPKPLSDWHRWMTQVIELRTLPRRGELLTALQHPGEQGEQDLEHDAQSGKQDAIAARAWLERMRRHDKPPSERFLLEKLLEQAEELLTPQSPPVLPAPPVSSALSLSDSLMSPYFFS